MTSHFAFASTSISPQSEILSAKAVVVIKTKPRAAKELSRVDFIGILPG
jgi:hypothetical protein